jgi:hypothetical protein
MHFENDSSEPSLEEVPNEATLASVSIERDDEQIPVATLAVMPTQRKTFSWGCAAMVCGALLLLLAITGTLGWLIWIQLQPNVPPPVVVESADEKYAYVAAAYSGEFEVDAQKKGEVIDLVARLKTYWQHAGEPDQSLDYDEKLDSELQECLDYSLIKLQIRRMRAPNGLPESAEENFFGFDGTLAYRAGAWFYDFISCKKTEVLAVRPIGEGNSYIAYLMLTMDDGTTRKLRVWVTETKGALKLYDYEILDSGIRFSVLFGIELWGVSPHLLSFDEEAELERNNQLFKSGTEQVFLAYEYLKSGEYSLHLLDIDSEFQKIDKDLLHVYDVIQYWESRATLSEMMGNFDQALDACNQLRTHNPEIPLPLLLEAKIYYAMGEYKRALQKNEAYQEMMGPDANALFRMGQIYLAMDHLDDAQAAFARSLKYNPSQPRAREMLDDVTNELEFD